MRKRATGNSEPRTNATQATAAVALHFVPDFPHSSCSPLLHRPADLRHGAVHRDHAGGRDRGLHAADRAVPADRRRRRFRCSATIPGASARSSPNRSPRRSSSRSTASKKCSTCRATARTTARTRCGVTFKPGVDLKFAQVLVQNQVNLALPSLPDVVKQTGVTTRKRSPDILMVVTLTSPNNRYDQLYLSNYAAIHIKDELARLDGVGDVIAFGRARLQHADLGRSRAAGRDEPERLATSSRPSAARTPRSPPARSASSRPGRISSGRSRSTRSAGSSMPEQFAQHRRQADRRRSHRPDQRHRPRRTRRQEHRRHQCAQHRRTERAPALLEPRHLPAARRQRARHGRARAGQDGGAGQGLSRRGGIRHPLRHDAVHPRVDQRSRADAVRARSCWSRSSCWSFCRAGDRR